MPATRPFRFPRPARLLRRVLTGAALVLGAVGLAAQDAPPPDPAPRAMVLQVEGAVSPAMSDYVRRALDDAAERSLALVVLKMDTPGGLDTSMREMIRAILASPVPVATWVAPSGARAASAGTYILYASHVAAMAPATNLGAATPVAIGGSPGGGEDRGDDGGDGANPFGRALQVAPDDPVAPDGDDAAPAGNNAEADEPNGDVADSDAEPAPRAPANASEAKAINDAVAYIRGLAELRGRNADWAEAAVRQAESLSASAALEQGVIDFIAEDITTLLERADGMVVKLESGEITLTTAGASVEEVEPDWRTALLSVITNPNVALILMLVGFYGLVFEFLNPGVLVPGTVGGISLILGLYSLALLPLNYAGIGLILLGLALIVAEAFAPSFGILGIGGTVALVIGAVILVDTDVEGLTVSGPLIAGVAATGLVLTLIVMRLAAGSFRARVVSGAEELLGAEARVMDWSGAEGHVWLHSERWRARGVRGLAKDETVRVTGMSGLVLEVERA